MKHSQVWDSLSLLAGILAVPLLIALFIIGWGAPGTAAYQTYELLNRLMVVGGWGYICGGTMATAVGQSCWYCLAP